MLGQNTIKDTLHNLMSSALIFFFFLKHGSTDSAVRNMSNGWFMNRADVLSGTGARIQVESMARGPKHTES